MGFDMLSKREANSIAEVYMIGRLSKFAIEKILPINDPNLVGVKKHEEGDRD